MRNNSYALKLGEVANITKLAGFEHTEYIQPNATSTKIQETDVPMYIGLNIKDGKLTDNIHWYIPKDLSIKLERSALTKKCIVLPYVGSVGDLAIYDHKDRHHLASNVAKIELQNEDKFSTDYLYYYLKSPYGQKQMLFYIQGGVQKNITMEALRKTEIRVIDKYQDVVSILSKIDSKIELNNRINGELEQMAKTIYDYWFVQFDFSDKNGKPYKTSGGKMVWNEELKREIPEGWKVGSLLDIAEYTNGLPCQMYRPNKGEDTLRVIKIKEMHEGFSLDTEYVRAHIPQKLVIDNGDILFSWSASLEVQIWSKGKGALNQHIFKVTSNKHPKSFYYFQLVHYLNHFKMMAENRKTTMGHITQEHLEQSRIVLPPKELTNDLETILSPLFAKKVNNEVENQKLVELRDWLLPMLMNGQVKIK